MTAALESPVNRSNSSYKSPSGSSVSERARAYNRRIEEETERRSQSPHSSRQHSRPTGNRPSTHERAYASLGQESRQQYNNTSSSKNMQEGGGSPARSLRSKGERTQQSGDNPVVSPELLVDALSGHEDGLLAIAERLMEHYDHGYDAMGEAIIDAFADVQKLFQHVVEAAHMEGAAFEASRREEEMRARGGEDLPIDGNEPLSPNGPGRHDEFVDQDVKDCLTEAIRQGTVLKEQQKFSECFELYESACDSASSLLPVDSDHRGRLQLSLSRAQSMDPDRACAILRYAMDDVLRSGMRAQKAALPDPSKRADVVLNKPSNHPSMSATSGQVVQSNEEALNSMVEEMKDMMSAPIYKDTPLQVVSERFFDSLNSSQKQQKRHEQKLEQNLGKLKGDFLLARAEWEEKLTHAQEQAELYKRHAGGLGTDSSIMDDSRSIAQSLHSKSMHEDTRSTNSSFNHSFTKHPAVESVISVGSGLGKHARTLVGSFACGSGIDEPTGGQNATQAWRDRRNGNVTVDKSRYADNYSPNGRSFRDDGRHVDV
ncbi:MAG: hypothetical protein SGBAC_006845 [Bacillariaceae sp.]